MSIRTLKGLFTDLAPAIRKKMLQSKLQAIARVSKLLQNQNRKIIWGLSMLMISAAFT